MQDVKLNQALELYFDQQAEKQSREYREAEKYLKMRIRPAMELLIRLEDTEKMELLENNGWFGEKELENFIKTAEEKDKPRSLIWLLHLKNKKYGYRDQDFTL
ncbi:MAG: hypothetical protein SO401_11390 [Blautia sp.]|nr:hypothetical protein [Blautia sp.]